MRRGQATGLGRALLIGVATGCMLFVPSAGATPGRTLHGTFASFPDYMDPQLAYTLEGWTAMYDTYIPLLTYRHASGSAGAEVVPGLARTLPRISDGGKTYTLFLRSGLRYSNGRRVRASDFEYTVERMFRLGSGGYPFYLDIVGASRFLRRERKHVSGIATNDATGKIVIHLAKPRSSFTQELGLLFVAPVPKGTPMRDQTFRPPPATGPYVITSSKPGFGWTYTRNPEWQSTNAKSMPRLPGGHVDEIQIDVNPNPSAQVDQVEGGEADWMQNPVPVDRLERVRGKYLGSQYRVEPMLNIYYFWMNTTKPPFDDVRVRRAVNYAIDRRALQRIYFRELTPTQQILPPGMPGYKQLHLFSHNMTKARRLIRQANPSDREITVWTDNESPNAEAGMYYAGVLRSLGFKTHLKVLGASSYFFVIGARSTPNLDTGWGNWFEDYPHPNDFFEPLLSGESILPEYTGNFAQIDVPALNRTIAKLSERPGPIPRARYAALDRRYMELAPWAPYGVRTLSTFVSKKIDLDKVIWNTTFGTDLTSFQFK